MRIAALYDVHGNLPALEAVLEQVRRSNVDAILVGGNPMYLAAAAALLGAALYYASAALAAYAAGFLLLAHAFVVSYEEPTLRRSFGDEYDRYCASVRRWQPKIPARV